MPREVTDIEFDGVFTRSEDRSYQVREYNYVFKYDAIDSETGEYIAQGEYRTIASDTPLNLDEAKSKMVELIETTGT